MKLYDNSDVIATLIITNLYLYRIWASGKAGIRNRNGNGNRKRNRNRNRNRKRNRNSNVKGNRYKNRDIIILILLQFIQKVRKLVWYHASPWISTVMNRKFNVSLDGTLLSHTTNLYSASYLPLCEFVESEHWKTENIQFPLDFWCPGHQLSRCLLRPLLHTVEVDEVLAGMGIGGGGGARRYVLIPFLSCGLSISG